MTRLILALPFLAACTHTPLPCDAVWPRTCEERRDAGQAAIDTRGEPVAERPVDANPPAAEPDDKPDHNGGKSNGGSSDSNGDNSDE
jgi:hypothetical protein